MPALELALRLWLLRGWIDPARGTRGLLAVDQSQGEVCDGWRGRDPGVSPGLHGMPCVADPPGHTVSVRLPSKERSSCFWAITWKKCPEEVCSPSERLKRKPPSRAPAGGGGVGSHWPIMAPHPQGTTPQPPRVPTSVREQHEPAIQLGLGEAVDLGAWRGPQHHPPVAGLLNGVDQLFRS